MLTLWNRIAERPLGAKIVAGVVLAGVFSLMVSLDVLDQGKATATSLTRPVASEVERTEAGAMMEPNRDCSSNRRHTSESEP